MTNKTDPIDKIDTADPATANTTDTITLDTPIQRGSGAVTQISLRKPKAGALRGVNLSDLVQMDYAAVSKVLPRITTPSLAEADLRDMDPADFFQLATAIAGFLLPNRMKAGSD